MSDYLRNPVEFLLTAIFQLYILAVMLRFLLQWVRADFYNPLSQAIVKLTNPVLRPLRRLIPGYAGLDLAAVLLMLLLQIVLSTLILLLRGAALEPLYILVWSLAELVNLTFNVFIYALVIQAILSWVSPGYYNPVSAILYKLTEPLLRPARRIVPPLSGLDLSPMVAILALYLLRMLVMPLFGLLLR